MMWRWSTSFVFRAKATASATPPVRGVQGQRGASSRVADDGTHHVRAADGIPLYEQRYSSVLPFHAPGLAPVCFVDTGEWAHIREDGRPAYAARHRRTFGFYEGLSSVVREDGAWHHILPTGEAAYAARWAWTGNFQSGRCTVRDAAAAYWHVDAQGKPRTGGPHAYAGDFREGFAVVRSPVDGLCRHVDLEGRSLPSQPSANLPAFLDLDVFHKSLARARDERGWFFVDKSGADICRGRRYAAVEPFYNGQALVHTLQGERQVIAEDLGVLVTLPAAEGEGPARLQHMSTAYWQAFALRMGILAGLPERVAAGEVSAPESGLRMTGADSDKDSRLAIAEAWKELGLLRGAGAANDPYSLTDTGALLLPGRAFRDKALYWVQERYLQAWLPGLHVGKGSGAASGVPSPAAPAGEKDTFKALGGDADALRLSHEVLAMHAAQDWAGIDGQILPAVAEVRRRAGKSLTLVDVGGGSGALLRQLALAGGASGEPLEGARLVCLDRPEVTALSRLANEQGSPQALRNEITFVAGDMFKLGDIPAGADVYMLSRVLHDWNDRRCVALLRGLRSAALAGRQGRLPTGKQGSTPPLLVVIDRIATEENAHAMLSLHMSVLQGARERWAHEWAPLFSAGGWRPWHPAGANAPPALHKDHAVFFLEPLDDASSA
jgi:hypothetical protein